MTTMNAMKSKFWKNSKSIYQQIDRLCGGALTIVVETIRAFINSRGMESAASMAYYALFSFFPLIIFIVGFVSSILKDEPVQQVMLDVVEQYLPLALDLVKGNIEHAVSISGTVQIIGTIGLLWAATGVFTALTHSIDRAWHTARVRNFVFGRLVALAMVAGLTGLLIAWVMVTTLVSVLPLFEIPILGEDTFVYQTYALGLTSRMVPWLLIFLLFLNVYRWVPNTTVRWREALAGAIIAALGWQIANYIFSWYLVSAWARYQLIYGSLGTVVALMLYVYVVSAIVLFGAHLSANIAWHTRSKKKRKTKK